MGNHTAHMRVSTQTKPKRKFIARTSVAAGLLSLAGVFAACSHLAKLLPSSDRSCAVTPKPRALDPARTLEVKNARLIPNLAYASVSPSQTLDLILPTGNFSGPRPLIVRIHGGAFQYGEAAWDEKGPAAQAILDAGYALASINYRVATEAPFPAAARDVKAAVRFLRAQAGKYGLDPRRFAAWGESAGGYFAVLLGVTGDQPTPFDDFSLGNPNISSAVAAVVDWYGPTDFAMMDQQQHAHPPKSCPVDFTPHTPAGGAEAFWLCGSCRTPLNDHSCSGNLAASNLIRYVATAKTLPHFAIAHGSDDCVVPWGQSQALVQALEGRGAHAKFTRREAYEHADSRFELTDVAGGLKTIAEAFERQ